MAAVELTDEAREDLRELDGSQRKAVLKALRKLETAPEQRGQPLGSQTGGNLTTFRKLVVQDRDLRVIYRVEPSGAVVVVWVIAARADDHCYDLAVSRLRMHPDREIAAVAGDLIGKAWGRSSK